MTDRTLGRPDLAGGGGGGGGGGGTEMTSPEERKPAGKRPWSKPRLALVEMDFTLTGGSNAPLSPLTEGDQDPASAPGPRYRTPS